MAQLKFSITCPRWINLDSQIKNACWKNDIEVSIEVDNHILTKDIRIKATASDEKIEQLKEAIAEYGEAVGANFT